MAYNLRIHEGNIIDFQNTVDVIVNAAKPTLEGGSGVDGSIHQAAGVQLLQECMTFPERPNRCNPGEVKVTNGYGISCRKIYHTVGVKLENKESYTQRDVRLQRRCYTNCLDQCVKDGFKSIAFPIIGSGSYKWDKKLAVQIAISEIHNWIIEKKQSIKIYLIVFNDDECINYAIKVLEKHRNMYKRSERSIALSAYQSQMAYVRDVWKEKSISLLFFVRLCLVLFPYFYPVTLFLRNVSGLISWTCRRRTIELMVILKLLLMLLFMLTPFSCNNDFIVYRLQPVFVIYLLCETILYSSSLLFLKDIQNASESNERSIFLFLLNLLEIQFGFAFLYKIFDVVKDADTTIDYLYYAFTNNGEITKQGYIIEIFQVAITFYMLSILLSLIVSGLKSRIYIIDEKK